MVPTILRIIFKKIKLKIYHKKVNAINMFGEAPLHAACLRGTLVSVCFLLNNRADVNVLNSFVSLSI